MIVWLRGDVEAARAAARIAASALEQRGFAARTVLAGPTDSREDILQRAREADGEGVLVFVPASELAPGERNESHVTYAIDAGVDPGRTAEEILEELEKRGALQWGYSRAEEEEIQKHLEDLGYL